MSVFSAKMISMFDDYARSIEERLRIAFPLSPISRSEIIPYQARDQKFADQVRDFIQGKKWDEIDLKSISNVFYDDRVSVLYFLGWNARRLLIPAMISMCLDGYRTYDIVLETVAVIMLNPTQEDDESYTADDWVRSFSKQQIAVIIDFIVFMKADFLNIYLGTAFSGDFSIWVKEIDRQNADLLAHS